MRHPACAKEAEILGHIAESIKRLACEYAYYRHREYANGSANGRYSHFSEQELRACGSASIHQADCTDTEFSSSNSSYQDDNQYRASAKGKLYDNVQRGGQTQWFRGATQGIILQLCRLRCRRLWA